MPNELPHTHASSRRDFLKQSGWLAALGAAGGLAPGRTLAQEPAASPNGGRAKNIIFMVSDGMSLGTLSMADQFVRLRDKRPSHWIDLYSQPGVARGLMDMSSASDLVTDSAAAASSWGCGQRVDNGRINVNHAGEWLDPILPIARRNGLRTGLVTTATVTHATPAGFAANGRSRQAEPDFAVQYLERDINVILGGGRVFFSVEHRGDRRDLAGEFRAKGYATPSTREELLDAPDDREKILGLFTPGHLPYEIDRLHDAELRAGVPSLAEMTGVALGALAKGDRGFLVQIEGARVDHAAHSNDISGLIYDQIAFDEAIAVAMAFLKTHPDTLLIVTTDHGNANPGLNQGSHAGARTLGRLRDFTGSLSLLGRDLGRLTAPTPAEIQRRVSATTGITLREEDARVLLVHLGNGPAAPYGRMSGLNAVLGQVLANTLEVGWVGNSHTSDYVELAAIGPGSEQIKPFNLNTEMFSLMTRVLDLDPAR